MIISHKHKFIFIKTEKTAGTSMEIALSKYCGPDDVITPITAKDELKRKKLGYRGPQNYRIPLSNYSKKDFLSSLYERKPKYFYNHISAKEIIPYIDNNIWDSYFKFCFERNPWDKVISWYFWRYPSEPRPTISEFIQSGEANLVKGFDLYTDSSNIVVDRVFLYEQISDAPQEISEQLNLDSIPELPFAKAGVRTDKRNYKEILSDSDKEKLSKVFAREIAYFRYEF